MSWFDDLFGLPRKRIPVSVLRKPRESRKVQAAEDWIPVEDTWILFFLILLVGQKVAFLPIGWCLLDAFAQGYVLNENLLGGSLLVIFLMAIALQSLLIAAALVFYFGYIAGWWNKWRRTA